MGLNEGAGNGNAVCVELTPEFLRVEQSVLMTCHIGFANLSCICPGLEVARYG